MIRYNIISMGYVKNFLIDYDNFFYEISNDPKFENMTKNQEINKKMEIIINKILYDNSKFCLLEEQNYHRIKEVFMSFLEIGACTDEIMIAWRNLMSTPCPY